MIQSREQRHLPDNLVVVVFRVGIEADNLQGGEVCVRRQFGPDPTRSSKVCNCTLSLSGEKKLLRVRWDKTSKLS